MVPFNQLGSGTFNQLGSGTFCSNILNILVHVIIPCVSRTNIYTNVVFLFGSRVLAQDTKSSIKTGQAPTKEKQNKRHVCKLL